MSTFENQAPRKKRILLPELDRQAVVLGGRLDLRADGRGAGEAVLEVAPADGRVGRAQVDQHAVLDCLRSGVDVDRLARDPEPERPLLRPAVVARDPGTIASDPRLTGSRARIRPLRNLDNFVEIDTLSP